MTETVADTSVVTAQAVSKAVDADNDVLSVAQEKKQLLISAAGLLRLQYFCVPFFLHCACGCLFFLVFYSLIMRPRLRT